MLVSSAATVATVAALAGPWAATAQAAPDPPAAAQGQGSPARTVSYDRYSLMIDGRRVPIVAGEFHYYRLPSRDLWRDVLEKYRAEGFNAISVYFHWGYHSPKPGVYDFTGVRDIDRLLRLADQLGLYVIARPGPYINAETTGGGFPAWLKNVPGRARSSAPGYTAAYREWLAQVDRHIARHQITRGGSVILYNAENEYAAGTDAAYMADIQRQARADGIDVPITTNNPSWFSGWASGEGAVQIPGLDDYPQSFDCPNAGTTWGPWGEGVTRRLRDDAPVFAAEYQAGSIDWYDAGYDKCRELTGVPFMKYFYKNNLIKSGATMFGYYMGFGGTNWGRLAQPNDVVTSYDYGAAITENRQLTTKYDEFKRQNLMLRTVAPLTRTDEVTGPPVDNAALTTAARADPVTGTEFVLVRHTDRAATTDDSGTLDWTVPDGRYSVPVRVDGRDAKVLIGGYDLGGQRLAVTSSELMTHVAAGGRDVALLYGREGEAGRTVLRYGSAPAVRVLSGQVRSAYADGNLTLDYTHDGLARVLVTGGGRRPLLLLLGTDDEAARFWRADTDAGPVLVRGTSLLRSANVTRTAEGARLDLRADTAEAGPIEVFGPHEVSGRVKAGVGPARLTVNGVAVAVRRTPSGSWSGSLPGPRPVRLPELTGWRARGENPEAGPGFDDSAWTVADRTTTESPHKPKTPPVLYADDYGFHHGHVWYRGRFTATGAETAVRTNAITGRKGVYQVWLNGRYLGSAAGGVQADAGEGTSTPANPDPGPGNFPVPSGLLKPGRPAVLSVLVENMGHNDDWTAEEIRHKQPRGLVAASVTGSSAPITWRIQGTRGGEDLVDPVRGPLNNGGLYGERTGRHLPGFPDSSWRRAAPGKVTPGVTWYRTSLALRLPKGQDVPLVLRFGDGGSGTYRVLMFLNGWSVGEYIPSAPQRDFTLPAGIVRERGGNTLALAVVAEGDATVVPPTLAGVANHRGGVPVSAVPAPSYRR